MTRGSLAPGPAPALADPGSREAGPPDRGEPDPAARRTIPLVVLIAPAVVFGLFLRVWVMNSPLAPLNADEAVTGLQGYDALDGNLRLIVAGNYYGGTIEAYVVAPLLTFWHGVGPLRLVPLVLGTLCGLAMTWTSRPLLGRNVAVVVGLVSWASSGLAIVVWSLAYMGYSSGVLAMVLCTGCSIRQMEGAVSRHLALGGGLSAGIALWCHPMFGAVALLALAPAAIRHIRSWRWLALTAAGGVLGLSPWLVFIVRHGRPISAQAPPTSYFERIRLFITELLPRAVGLRSRDGQLIGNPLVSGVIAACLIGGALVGLVLLVRRRGPRAWPAAVSGIGAVLVLALFKPLAYVLDARYSLPFMPALLIGLGSWLLLAPRRVTRSPWLVVLVPVVWMGVFCLPAIHREIGWTWQDPDRAAIHMVAVLDERDITALRGDYWGVYLLDYLAHDQLDARPDYSVRFDREARRADIVPLERTAYIFPMGSVAAGRATLPFPTAEYDLLSEGGFDLWIPR